MSIADKMVLRGSDLRHCRERTAAEKPLTCSSLGIVGLDAYLVQFTVTDDHLKLLRSAYVGWDSGEFGAPAIDCKRPYGNSSVYNDIAEILGIKADEDGEFTEQEYQRMDQLHKETQTVLQIILATGTMQTGTYEADKYHQNWRLVV